MIVVVILLLIGIFFPFKLSEDDQGPGCMTVIVGLFLTAFIFLSKLI